MFSQASVILSTGGGCLPLGRGVYTPHWAPPGRHPLLDRHPPPQTDTAADDTHPSGMHSCSYIFLRGYYRN